MAKFDTLTDSFDTQLSPAKWGLSGTLLPIWDAATKSAKLPVAGTTTMAAIGTFDLTGSYIYGKFTFPAVLSPTQIVNVYLRYDSANYLRMIVTGNLFQCLKTVANTVTTVFSATYLPAVHGPWWRMREAGGTVYFDVSSNGTEWTTLGTTATPSFATGLSLYIQPTGGPSDPVIYLYVDSINAYSYDPWVLMTGPKGATGSPRPLPQAPGLITGGGVSMPPPLATTLPTFRRFAQSGGTLSDNGWDNSGFFLLSGFLNYSPNVGGGHCRLQMVRTPQGICTYSGLIYLAGAGTSPYLAFALPWDGLPNPVANRVTTLVNVNNQRGRFDALPLNGSYVGYQWDSSAVTPNNGAFTAVQFSIPTYMPQVWVDYGMKTDCVAMGSNVQFTVGPGQMSGYIKGAPVTITNPARTTFILPNSGAVYTFLYYDMVAGQYGQRVAPTLTLSGHRDPTNWIGLANEGKVSLAVYLSIGGGAVAPVDRRFFMYGPLDTLSGVPA